MTDKTKTLIVTYVGPCFVTDKTLWEILELLDKDDPAARQVKCVLTIGHFILSVNKGEFPDVDSAADFMRRFIVKNPEPAGGRAILLD